MQRTPDHRDVLVFKKLEIARDLFYILHYEVILPCTRLQGFPDVESGLFCVESIAVEVVIVQAIVPVGLAVRNVPVPHIVHQTVVLPLFLLSGDVIIVLNPAPPVRSRRIGKEKEVIAGKGRMLSCRAVDQIHHVIGI